MTEMQTPTPPAGPRKAQIVWLWNEAWKAYNKGEVSEFYIRMADADLARFAASSPLQDAAAQADLNDATSYHIAQSKHFEAEQANVEYFRTTIGSLRDTLMEQNFSLAQFTYRSLSLANGAIVLATLAFLGNKAQGPIPDGIIFVIILGSVGFLLTLLAAHLGVLLITRPVRLLTESTVPRLAPQVRKDKMAVFQRSLRWLRVSMFVNYAAFGCLAGAIVVGTSGLVTMYGKVPAVQPPAASSPK